MKRLHNTKKNSGDTLTDKQANKEGLLNCGNVLRQGRIAWTRHQTTTPIEGTKNASAYGGTSSAPPSSITVWLMICSSAIASLCRNESASRCCSSIIAQHSAGKVENAARTVSCDNAST